MKKEFIAKLLHERSIDTNTYRYIIKDCGSEAHILRIELNKLDTTEAINGWKLVKIIK